MPRARLLVVCAVSAVAVVGPTASADAEGQRVLESPRLPDVARASSRVQDSVLSPAAARRLDAAPAWGGSFTAGTGEAVKIFVSSAYPEDPATGQRWADFFGGLVHGPELSQLTAYLAPLVEVQSVCGSSALACYSPSEALLVTPGESPSALLSAEAVAAHEYGHHIASHRSNAPWEAVDYGTKRWASHLQVCARTRSGELYPGDAGFRYRLNPGEGFAEVYRILNERRLGLPESEWSIVASVFYPDDTALALVDQDVTTPWQPAATVARTGSLTKARRVRTYPVSTPLDGTFKASLRAPAKARFELELLSSAGARLARKITAGRTVSVTTMVCGGRAHRLRVSRIAGAGRFSLSIATP